MSNTVRTLSIIGLAVLMTVLVGGCKKKKTDRIQSISWLKMDLKSKKWVGFTTTRLAHVTQVWNALHRLRMNPLKKVPPKEKMPKKTQEIRFHEGSGSVALKVVIFGNRYLFFDGKYYKPSQIIIALTLLEHQGDLSILPPEKLKEEGFDPKSTL